MQKKKRLNRQPGGERASWLISQRKVRELLEKFKKNPKQQISSHAVRTLSKSGEDFILSVAESAMNRPIPEYLDESEVEKALKPRINEDDVSRGVQDYRRRGLSKMVDIAKEMEAKLRHQIKYYEVNKNEERNDIHGNERSLEEAP